jgi:primosomal protein N' (replication factor Y)
MARLDNQTRSRVRALRRNPTEAEKKLWLALRDALFFGHRFRRQYPISPYIIDLACVDAKLIIEVDGGQHAESASDAKRDKTLTAAGWRVLRFWNHDVLQNVDGILVVIRAALDAPLPRHPHPNPPPAELGEGFTA